jgi:hypothetical protein
MSRAKEHALAQHIHFVVKGDDAHAILTNKKSADPGRRKGERVREEEVLLLLQLQLQLQQQQQPIFCKFSVLFLGFQT